MNKQTTLEELAIVQEARAIANINNIICKSKLTMILDLLNDSREKYGYPGIKGVVRFSNVMMAMEGINRIADASLERVKDPISHLMIYWMSKEIGITEYNILSMADSMDLSVQNKIQDRLLSCVKYRLDLLGKKKSWRAKSMCCCDICPVGCIK